MQLSDHWSQLRSLWNQAFRSSLHFAVATVQEDGAPHLAPVGSVLLMPTPGQALYFEEFLSATRSNLDRDPRISVLAVNSSRWFWLLALLRGRFAEPPAVRLDGTVGPRRPASDRERTRWLRRVRFLRGTPGYRLLWQKYENVATVRDVSFKTAQPVLLGPMTRGCWRDDAA